MKREWELPPPPSFLQSLVNHTKEKSGEYQGIWVKDILH